MRTSNSVLHHLSVVAVSAALAIGGAGLFVTDAGLTAGASSLSTLSLDGQHSQVLDVTYTPSGNADMYVAASGPSLANPWGGIEFQVPQGAAGLLGTHSVYLTTSWNGTLSTTSTITVAANWTQATYVTRSTSDHGAFGRLEIQAVTSGNYNMNDYWWFNPQTLGLNYATSGTITASLSNLAGWTNICGKAANDPTIYSGTDCTGRPYPAVSPADGFVNALQNVREINISFGRTSSFSSGIATTSTTPVYFNLTQLSIG